MAGESPKPNRASSSDGGSQDIGACAVCGAFATAAAMEGQIVVATGISLSVLLVITES